MKNSHICDLKKLTSLGRGAVFSIAVIVMAGVATALACGWWLWTDHSVRFNGVRTGRGFYRLPPLPIMYDPETGKELTVAQVEEDIHNGTKEYDNGEANAAAATLPDPDKAWTEARVAAEQGDLDNAQASLNTYLKLTDAPPIDEG